MQRKFRFLGGLFFLLCIFPSDHFNTFLMRCLDQIDLVCEQIMVRLVVASSHIYLSPLTPGRPPDVLWVQRGGNLPGRPPHQVCQSPTTTLLSHQYFIVQRSGPEMSGSCPQPHHLRSPPPGGQLASLSSLYHFLRESSGSRSAWRPRTSTSCARCPDSSCQPGPTFPGSRT